MVQTKLNKMFKNDQCFKEQHRWRMGEKIQGIRRIIGRYRIDRGRLTIVQEMEKPKNLYVPPMDMN